MEAINSIAGAAGKAIWGDSRNTAEPLSGEKGAGTKNEPYDNGNVDGVDTTTSSTVNGNAISDTNDTYQTSQEQQGADRPGAEPNATETSAIKESKDIVEDEQSGDKDVIEDEQSGDKDVIEDEQSGDKDTPKVPHTDAEREAAMKSGNFPRDPNDHSGEPLHMHGGGDGGDGGDGAEAKKDRKQSVGQEGGQPHGKGNGDKYFKSSGMAVDGGDFDATNPGAGTEANRLMEEKGIRKGEDVDSTKADTTVEVPPESSDKLGKVSKMDKVKEKLRLKK